MRNKRRKVVKRAVEGERRERTYSGDIKTYHEERRKDIADEIGKRSSVKLKNQI
jgi:hypothetical protein